jgi:hypothetical protein
MSSLALQPTRPFVKFDADGLDSAACVVWGVVPPTVADGAVFQWIYDAVSEDLRFRLSKALVVGRVEPFGVVVIKFNSSLHACLFVTQCAQEYSLTRDVRLIAVKRTCSTESAFVTVTPPRMLRGSPPSKRTPPARIHPYTSPPALVRRPITLLSTPPQPKTTVLPPRRLEFEWQKSMSPTTEELCAIFGSALPAADEELLPPTLPSSPCAPPSSPLL